jgi:hypothetical protein
MPRNFIFAVILAFAGLALSSLGTAANALLNFLNSIVPGGSADAVQYNAGSENFRGVDPIEIAANHAAIRG